MLSFDLSRLRFVAAVVLCLVAVERAQALTIELKDVAPDRVERQRAAATGALPLPGTPNVALLQERLQDKGVTLASPVLIRIFKAESELEIWKQKDRDGAFILFATYPICHWSGTLGPKLRDGDRQAPEGFYTVARAQARHVGRWPVSIDIGYPNILDQSQARTGSDILIHGGCSSVGCFAMTNPVSEEVHQLTLAAIDAGQSLVPVEIFPFRMTNENMIAQSASPWKAFWNNLKEGYDLFERTRRPPTVGVCSGRYIFSEAPAGALPGPLDACQPTLASIREQDQWLNDVPRPTAVLPKIVTRRADTQSTSNQQMQTSLESDATAPPPMFSWPLVR